MSHRTSARGRQARKPQRSQTVAPSGHAGSPSIAEQGLPPVQVHGHPPAAAPPHLVLDPERRGSCAAASWLSQS